MNVNGIFSYPALLILLTIVLFPFEVKSPGDSRQGSKIAFMHDGHVCVVDTDGSNYQQLATDPRYGLNRPITWRPDGQAILFWNHVGPGWAIWQVTLGGKQSKLIEAATGGVRNPCYSPDGTRIAYMRDNPNGLYVCRSDGTNEIRLTEFGHRDNAPVWAPDSSRIAIAANDPDQPDDGSKIWIITLEGQSITEVGQGNSPNWCKATGRLYCIARKDGVEQIAWIAPNQFQEQPANSVPTPHYLTTGCCFKAHPTTSPDGTWIAFLVENDDRHSLIVRRTSVDGGPEIGHSIDIGGQAADFSWSPDGRRLAYLEGEDGNAAIRIATITDNQLATTRIFEGNAEFVTWQPAGR